MIRGGIIQLCLLIVLALNAAYGQEPQVRPYVNRPFVDPDFREWVARFERPGREVYDQRHLIVEATGVKAGLTVADIGAGTGLIALMLAQRSPAETIDAIEGSLQALGYTTERIGNVMNLTRKLVSSGKYFSISLTSNDQCEAGNSPKRASSNGPYSACQG